MDFKVEISNKVDEEVWNDKLLQHHGSTIYQIPRYSNVYLETFDSKPIFISIKNSLGEIGGQLSALVHTRFYWRDSNIVSKTIGSKLNLNPILIWNYGPIIHDNSHKDEILSKILSVIDEIAIKNKITMIRGTSCPLSETFDTKIFEKHGYKTKTWSTYVTDLKQNSDDLYNKLSKETRYDIRKSEKNELEFEIVSDLSTFREYEELAYSARIRNKEMRKKNLLFVENFWKNLYDHGYLKVFLVRKEGELLGGITGLVFNRNIIQYGVVNSPKTHLLGGTFLTWNVIKWSINMKYLTYDMGGINPNPENEKEKSINFYKSKWGGEKLDYVRYTKVLSGTRMKISAALNDPKKISKKIKRIMH